MRPRHRGVWRVEDADRALQAACARLLPDPAGERVHRFSPRGVSVIRWTAGVTLVAHSWPERDRVSIDVYAVEPIEVDRHLQALGWTRAEGEEWTCFPS